MSDSRDYSPEEVIHIGGYFTGSEEGDENLFQQLGRMGALAGAAKRQYEAQKAEAAIGGTQDSEALADSILSKLE